MEPSITSPSHRSVPAFPMQQPIPEFFRLERSIRALSTAIHEIEGQCEFRASSCESGITDKQSKAFSHLATLLTTGSPVGRQTIAVTGGASHRGFYINLVEAVAGNKRDLTQIPSKEPAVKLNTIPPSQKTLKQLAEDKFVILCFC